MTKLHVISTEGFVSSQDYKGALVNGAPHFSLIKELIGGGYVEHVNVLWKGKPAHLFVDEDGHFKKLKFNAKATRIYWNNSFRKMHLQAWEYDNLSIKAQFAQTLPMPDVAKRFIESAAPILGIAVLWEGKFE